MNITRSSMNNSIILVVRYNRMINSENMIKNWMEKQTTYWALALGKMNGDDRTKMVVLTECSSRCRRRWFAAAPDLDEGRAMMKILEQLRRTLPKNLIHPKPNLEDRGSGDLLSRSLVHADARDGLGHGGSAAARKDKTLGFVTLVWVCNLSLSWYIFSGGSQWVRYIVDPYDLLNFP